jgi:AraC-like DNA-binding protein
MTKSELIERFAKHYPHLVMKDAEVHGAMPCVDRLGMAALKYLTNWLIALASAALRDGKSLSSIAESVGYGSDAASNSAFKRLTGQSPGRYRSQSA